MKIPGTVLAALAVILALIVVRECGYRAGAKHAQARAVDARTDSVVLKLRREARDSGLALARWRDSTGREIRRLEAAMKSERPAPPSGEPVPSASRDITPHPPASGEATGTVLPPHSAAGLRPSVESRCAGAPAQCDTLIQAYAAGRAQDSLQLLFWQSQVAQRDSLVSRLTQARDAWRKQAQRPSYTVTDVGGGAIAGWGLAEKSPTVVAVGAAVILVPRAWGFVRHIF